MNYERRGHKRQPAEKTSKKVSRMFFGRFFIKGADCKSKTSVV